MTARKGMLNEFGDHLPLSAKKDDRPLDFFRQIVRFLNRGCIGFLRARI
jgi:hypothetical protein